MDFHLAREMGALGADVPLRRQNLLNLLSTLTSYELRDIGKYLAQVDFRTDVFGRLPVELRLEIAEYLDPADLFNFLEVSKTWRKAWSHSTMINLFMPGFLEYHRQKDAITSSARDVHDLFYRACQWYQPRCRGKYLHALVEKLRSVSRGSRQFCQTNFALATDCNQRTDSGKSTTSGLELLEPPVGPGFRNLLYSDGRVAWQPQHFDLNHALIIVDNLKSRLRKEYTIPEAVIRGGNAKLVALGDMLVVASLDRTLHAWDLKTNEHCSVTLPSSTFCCKTYGKQVYIHPYHLAVKSGGAPTLQVYTWKFKDSLRELDTAPLLSTIGEPSQQPEKQLPWYCAGIIPHPLLDDTIYVVCELGRTISLHKYTRGVHTACLSFVIPEEEGHLFQSPVSRRLSRLNSYGKYLIAVCGSKDGCRFYSTVSFDSTRETFSVEKCMAAAKDNTRGNRTYFTTWWDSQIISYSCRETQISLEITRKRGPAGEEEQISKELIPRGLYTKANSLLFQYRSEEDAQLIFADDNFIVICRPCGYLALSFRTKFKGPGFNPTVWDANQVDRSRRLDY